MGADRLPIVGDAVEIHDLGSSVHDAASWHPAVVVEVRTPAAARWRWPLISPSGDAAAQERALIESSRGVTRGR